MTAYQSYLGYWIALLVVVFSLSCSQSSSQLSPEKAKPNTDIVDGAEEVTGIDALEKPVGELNEHLTVTVPPLQYSDSNLLVLMHGQIESQSGIPLRMARWSQISGPAATILSPNELQTLVLVPDVEQPQDLVFRLYGVNNGDYTNAATTKLRVQPPADTADARVISAAVNEEVGAIDFTIALGKPANVPISVSYRTLDRTAIAQEDYLPVNGILTFEPGETRKLVSVEIIDDGEADDGEIFELTINGTILDEDGEKTVTSTGVGVIKDNEKKPSFPTTVPLPEGPADLEQLQLPGSPGNIRINLQWDQIQDDLNIIVTDPCEQTLFAGEPQIDCLGGIGLMDPADSELPFENAFWPDYAPPGQYVVSVQHFEGRRADYDLRLFYGEESQRFTGTIANGDEVEVFRFDFLGAEGGSSSAAESSSSEVAASSAESSTSSVESSTSNEESSTSNEESSTSSLESSTSSEESSTSNEESSASSSESSTSSEEPSASSSEASATSSPFSSSTGVSSQASESSNNATSSQAPESSSVSSVSANTTSSSSSSVPVSSVASSSDPLSSSSLESSSQSSEASSSELVSSSSAAAIIPSVTLSVDTQAGPIGAQLVVSGTAILDPSAVLDNLLFNVYQNNALIGEIPSELIVQGSNLDFSTELDLEQHDLLLSSGVYSLTLVAVDSLGQRGESAPQSVNITLPTELVIDLDAPEAGVFYAPVLISGTIIANENVDVSAQITLSPLSDTGSPDVSIPLEDDNAFTYLVTAPGQYELTISAEDGYSQVDESVLFSYLDPELVVELTTSAPIVEGGLVDIIDALPISADVTGEVLPEPVAAALIFGAEGEEVAFFELPIAEVWAAGSGQISTTLPLQVDSLDYGQYQVHLRTDFAEFGVVDSNALELQFREPQPLSVQLTPLLDQAYLTPVPIAGSISADPLRNVLLSATLVDLEDSDPPQPVNLVRNGDQFSYTVDVPGSYRFTVTASDGVEEVSVDVDFVYQAPEFSVSLSHQLPLLDNGAIDAVGGVTLTADILANLPEQLQALNLVAIGDGTTFTLETLDLSGSTDERDSIVVSYAWQPEQLPAGNYSLQFQLLYGDGDVALSAPVEAVLRASETLAISLDPLASLHFAPAQITGSVVFEVTRPLTVSGSLIDLTGAADPQPVVLDVDAAGAFAYTVDQPGLWRFSATADDGVSDPVTASVDFEYQIAEASVQLLHDEVLNDNGEVETLAAFDYTAQVTTSNPAALSALTFEYNDGTGWVGLADLNLANLQGDEVLTLAAAFDFAAAAGIEPGVYNTRLRLDYGAGQTAFSDPVAILYRTAVALELSFDDGFNGQQFFAPVTITGSVVADPLLSESLQLSAQLITDDQTGTEPPVTLSAAGFSIAIAQPGAHTLTVTATDGVVDVSQSITFTYDDPDLAVELDIPSAVTDSGQADVIDSLPFTASVTGAITPEPLSAVLVFSSNGVVAQSFDLSVSEIWQAQSGQLTSNLALNESGLPLGLYEVYLTADFGELGVVDSNAVSIQYRAPVPISLQLDPLAEDVFFTPVPLSGSVTSDPLRDLSLSATLDDLEDSDPPQPINLVRNGDQFSYTVDVPGSYRFTVIASDGVEEVSVDVDFVYQAPEFSVSLSHQLPLLDNGAIDAVGGVTLTANVLANLPEQLQALNLVAIGDGTTFTLETLDLSGSTDEQDSIVVSYAWQPEQLPAGNYSLQFQLLYGDGDVALSAPVEAVLRASETLAISLDPLASLHFAPAQITGSVVFEVTRPLTVSGSLIDLTGAADPQPVALNVDAAGVFAYTVDQPGLWRFSATADDGVSDPVIASVDFEYQIAEASVQLLHDEVLNDNGEVETLAAFNYTAQVTTSNPAALSALTFEYNDGTGWVDLADLNLANLQGDEVLTLAAAFDFAAGGVDPGVYTTRLRLDYGAGQTAFSDPVAILYRTAVALDLSFDDGFDGQQFFTPVTVTGSVVVDPLLSDALQLSAQLVAEDQSVTDVDTGLSGSLFSVPVDQPGVYTLTVAAADGVTQVARSIAVSYQIPDVQLFVEHDHPTDEAGVLDLLADPQFTVSFTSDQPITISAFAIESTPVESLGEPAAWTGSVVFDFDQVWNAQTETALLSYPLDADTDLGLRAYRIRADIAGFGAVYSDSVFGQLRSVQALLIALDTPQNNASYFADVPVSGSVSWEPQGTLQLNATINNLSDPAPAQPLPLTVINGSFTGLVDEPGNYQLVINGDDGFNQSSVTTQFVYVDTTLAVSAEPQHPANENGQFDLTGPLNVLIRVNGDDALPKQAFDLQVAGDDGQWGTIQSYDYDAVWDETSDSALLNFDFLAQELTFGDYSMRVQLRYADGLSESSLPFELVYRAYIGAQITVLQPGQESIHYQNFRIVAGVESDPNAGLITVTGDYTIDGAAQSVVFSDGGDGTYFYDVNQPGSYDMTIQVDDSNTDGIDDSDRLITAYIAPQIDVQLQHGHPLLADGAVDLFQPIDLNVSVDNNTARVPLEFELIAINDQQETLLQSYPADTVWTAQTQSANLIYDFANQPLGAYSIYVRVLFDGPEGLTGQSEILPVVWRNLDPLTLTIDSPAEGFQSPIPVSVQGSVTADSAVQTDLTATLLELDSGDPAQEIVLNQNGNAFDYLVDQPGNYQLVVNADNGLQQASTSVDFSYQIQPLLVSIDHVYPVLDNGDLDIINPAVSFTATVANPQQYSLQQFALEIFADGNWVEMSTAVISDAQLQQDLAGDLSALQLDIGLYPVRVRVDYLGDQTSFSPVVQLSYRQPIAPIISSVDAPQQGLIIGSSLAVSGTYQLDPLAALAAIEATLQINGDPQFGPLPMAASNGNFNDLLVDDRLASVNEISLVAVDSLGNRSTAVVIPFTFIFDSQLFVDIVEPALPTLATVQPRVDLTVDFFPVAGVDLDVRLLDLAGAELLLDTVEDNTSWQVAAGQLTGTFDFSPLLPLPASDYVLQVIARYPDGTVLTDNITVAYAEPALPVVTIDTPQAQTADYSFAVDVAGTVQVDDVLDSDSLTAVYAQLTRVQPNPATVVDRIELEFEGGSFAGLLSENMLTESALYELSVWADDSLGRTSDPATVQFNYQVPVDLVITPVSPVAPPGANQYELIRPQVDIQGRIQFQPNYPVESLTLSFVQDGVVLPQTVDLLDGLNANGSFNSPIDLNTINIAEGFYLFRLTAVDSENRTASVDLPVNYQALASPTISLQALPKDDASLLGGPYSITYSVDPRAENLTLSGQIDHQDGTTDSLTIPAPTIAAGQQTVSFVVEELQVRVGVNAISVTLDDGQNSVSDSAQINFTRPQVTIVEPEFGQDITTRTFPLVFAVDYMGPEPANTQLTNISILVNGQTQQFDNQPVQLAGGSWQQTIDASNLASGQHQLSVQVGDYRRAAVVNQPPATTQFNILAAPTINFVSPAGGSDLVGLPPSTTPFHIFEFEIDFDGVDPNFDNFTPAVDFLINGAPAENGVIIDRNVSQQNAAGSRYRLVYTGESGFIEGANTLTLVLQDYRVAQLLGRGELNVNFIPYPPPVISILRPANGDEAPSGRTLDILFNVQWAIPSDDDFLPNWDISINGGDPFSNQSVSQNGNDYTVTIPTAQLVDGSNTILVRVADRLAPQVIGSGSSTFTFSAGALTNFDVEFAYPYLIGTAAILEASFDPDSTIDTLEVAIDGTINPGLTQTNLSGGEASIRVPLNFFPPLQNDVAELTFLATNGSVQETVTKRLDFGAFEEFDQDTLFLDLATQVEMLAQGTGRKIFHGDLSGFDISANQQYFEGSPVGENYYYIGYFSPGVTINFGASENGGFNQIQFGPDVLPENVFMIRDGDHLRLLIDEGPLDGFEGYPHAVLNYFNFESVFEGMLFADGTLWNADDVLEVVRNSDPFGLDLSMGDSNQLVSDGSIRGRAIPVTPEGFSEDIIEEIQLSLNGTSYDFIQVPQPSNFYNYRVPLVYYQRLLGSTNALVVDTQMAYSVSSIGRTVDESFAVYVTQGAAGEYPDPDDTRELMHLNYGGRGYSQATTRAENNFYAEPQINQRFGFSEGLNKVFLNQNSGVDLFRLGENPGRIEVQYVATGIANGQSFEFGRVANTDDLIISQVGNNPAMWQTFEGFFAFDDQPFSELRFGTSSLDVWPNSQIPVYEWSEWFDRDDVSGNGDFELLRDNFPECFGQSIAVQARVVGQNTLYHPGDSDLPDVLQTFNAQLGLECNNDTSGSNSCSDYEIRHLCPQNLQPNIQVVSIVSPSADILYPANTNIPIQVEFPNLSGAVASIDVMKDGVELRNAVISPGSTFRSSLLPSDVQPGANTIEIVMRDGNEQIVWARESVTFTVRSADIGIIDLIDLSDLIDVGTDNLTDELDPISVGGLSETGELIMVQ